MDGLRFSGSLGELGESVTSSFRDPRVPDLVDPPIKASRLWGGWGGGALVLDKGCVRVEETNIGCSGARLIGLPPLL